MNIFRGLSEVGVSVGMGRAKERILRGKEV
jgi:hypothetical protein